VRWRDAAGAVPALLLRMRIWLRPLRLLRPACGALRDATRLARARRSYTTFSTYAPAYHLLWFLRRLCLLYHMRKVIPLRRTACLPVFLDQDSSKGDLVGVGRA